MSKNDDNDKFAIGPFTQEAMANYNTQEEESSAPTVTKQPYGPFHYPTRPNTDT